MENLLSNYAPFSDLFTLYRYLLQLWFRLSDWVECNNGEESESERHVSGHAVPKPTAPINIR